MFFAHCAVLAAASFLAFQPQAGAIPAPSHSKSSSTGETESSRALVTCQQGRIAFEANRGQTAPSVSFLQRGDGYTLFLSPTEAVFVLGSADESIVRMKIAGAREGAELVGTDRAPGTVNYFQGSSPSGWIQGVPTYVKVMAREVYDGIDLVYRGSKGRLEYDFVVAAGAHHGDIRLRFEGASRLEINEDGDLVLQKGSGALVHAAPVIYQENGDTREQVPGGFVLLGPNEVGFEVGAHDPARPLVIDPTVAYSSLLGGSGDDGATGIATDWDGNSYLAGYTASVDFPVTSGFSAGGTDAFVVKLDPTGSTVYSTFLGGASGDSADGISTDSITGEVYIAGDTQSADFPVTTGAYQSMLAGGIDLFVCKLDEFGVLSYSTYVGGSANDVAFGMALGPGPSVYVTGRTHSGDFQTTVGTFDDTLDGGSDAFLVVVAPDGAGSSDLKYSTYLGGGLTEQGFDVAVDPDGVAYLTGSTIQEKNTTPKFPSTANAYRPSVQLRKNSFLNSIYLSKLDPTGNGGADLVYSTFFMRKPGLQSGRAVAADGFGRAYVAGICSDSFPTTAGAFDPTYNGGQFYKFQDVFVAVVDTNQAGEAGLAYATYLGGYDGENPEAIAVEGATAGAAGTIHVAGVAVNEEPHPNEPLVEPFPTTGDAFQTATAGYGEGFYSMLEPAGNGAADLRFSTLLGGDASEIVWGVALDSGGAVHLAGQTDSSDFVPLTSGAPAGGLDVFYLRVEFGPEPPAAPSDLTATALSSSEIILVWTDNASDEDGFEVERSFDGGNWSPLVTLAANATGHTDSGLAAQTRYYYRVRAFNGLGSSGYSNVADATTPPDGGGGDALANGEIAVAGTVTGSFSDTWADDGAYEEIRERQSGGKPANRTSYLEHKWTFDVTVGSPVTLYLDAYHSPSSDGDNFVFAYSTDDSSYTDAITITAASPSGTYQTYVIPSSPSGTVYVRVLDTDRTAGNRSLDTIFVDHVFIRSGSE